MIFRSEWKKLKHKWNLVRCFLLHSTKFQYFFVDSKVNCQIHMITDMFKNISKEYLIKMMMIMICFCGMVDWRKAFSLISSRDHCQRSSPLRISDTPWAGFEPAQNLSSGLVEWSCAVVITTTPWSDGLKRIFYTCNFMV